MAKRKLPVPIPLESKPEKPRMTCTMQVVHQVRGDEPGVVQASQSKLLEHAEQIYERRLTLGPDFMSLVDLGCWFDLEMAGTICLKNVEGQDKTSQPTKEQQAEIDKHVVEISAGDGGLVLLVPPGWTQPLFFPAGSAALRFRCLDGKAMCRITVFPK